MTSYIQRNEYVIDTMGLVLRIERRRLNSEVKTIFSKAESGEVTIYIPSLVFAEVLYLSEKKRISLSLSDVSGYLERFSKCKEFPMSFDVIKSTAEITDITELHDRLIAGTARLLNLDLVTNDPIIQASKFVRTLW